MNHGPYVVSAGSMTTVLKVKFKLTEIHFHSIQFSEEFAFADTLSTEPPSQSLTAWCVWGGGGERGVGVQKHEFVVKMFLGCCWCLSRALVFDKLRYFSRFSSISKGFFATKKKQLDFRRIATSRSFLLISKHLLG